MSADAGTGATVALDYSFSAAPTGKTGAALTSASAVLVNDPAIDPAVKDNGDAVATLVAQALTGPLFEKSSELLARVVVTGADANEVLVVRIDARLECLAGAKPSGTLYAAQEHVLAAKAGSSNYIDQKIGQQTVPFNSVGSVGGIDEAIVELDACFTCVEPCSCDTPSTLRGAVGKDHTLPILTGLTGTASVRHCAVFANRGTVASTSMAVGHGVGSGFANLNGAASFARADGAAANSLAAGERAAWTHVSTINLADLANKVGHSAGDWAVVVGDSCVDTGSGATGPPGRAIVTPPAFAIGLTKERRSDSKHRAGSDSAVEYRLRATGSVQARTLEFVDRLPQHLSLNLATVSSASGASGLVATTLPSSGTNVTVRVTGPGGAAFDASDAQVDLFVRAALGAPSGVAFNWATVCARNVSFGGSVYSLGAATASGIALPDLCTSLPSPAGPVDVALGCANNTAPSNVLNAAPFRRTKDNADTAAIAAVAAASSKTNAAVTACVDGMDDCYSTCGVEQLASCIVSFLSCVGMPATTPVKNLGQLYASVTPSLRPHIAHLTRNSAFDQAQGSHCLCPVVPGGQVVVVPPPALESWPFVEDDSDFAATASITELYEAVNLTAFVPDLSELLGDDMTTRIVDRPEVVAMTTHTEQVIEVEIRTVDDALRGGLLLSKGPGILEHSMAGCSRFSGATVVGATTTTITAAGNLPVALSLIDLSETESGHEVVDGTPSRILVASMQLALRRDGIFVSSQPTPLAYAQESAVLQTEHPGDVVAYISAQAWEATDVMTGLSRSTLEALVAMVKASAGPSLQRTLDVVPSLVPLTPPNFWLSAVSTSFPDSVTVHLAGRQRNLTGAISSLRVQCWSGGAGSWDDSEGDAVLLTVDSPDIYVAADPLVSNPLTTDTVSLAVLAGGATLLRSAPIAYAPFDTALVIPTPGCLDVVVTLDNQDDGSDLVSDVVYTNTGFFFAFGGTGSASTVTETAGTTGIVAAGAGGDTAVSSGNAEEGGSVAFRRGYTLSPILPRLPLQDGDIPLAGMGTVICAHGCDVASAGLVGVARSLAPDGGPVDLPANVSLATALAFVPAGSTASLELSVEYEEGDDSVATLSSPTAGCWSLLKVPVDATRRPTTLVMRSNTAGPQDFLRVTWTDLTLRASEPAVADEVLVEACGGFGDGGEERVEIDADNGASFAALSKAALAVATTAVFAY